MSTSLDAAVYIASLVGTCAV